MNNKKKEEMLKKILENDFHDNQLIELHEETVNHSYRCFNMAKDFGNYLRLPDNKIESLSKCALFHDLGKFKINASLLYKTESLKEEEFTVIKNHVNYNPKSNLCKDILNCIKYHHERPDNNGYGKNNYEEILPSTKIISIIDAFDAISNKRCYKSAPLDLVSAIEEIKRNIGKQFDEYYGRLFVDFLSAKL